MIKHSGSDHQRIYVPLVWLLLIKLLIWALNLVTTN